MAYFSKFPKGFYDMKGDGNVKLVTDLLRRVSNNVMNKKIDQCRLGTAFRQTQESTPT